MKILMRLLDRISPKLFRESTGREKSRMMLLIGNVIIWSPTLISLSSYIVGLDIEYPMYMRMFFSAFGLFIVLTSNRFVGISLYSFRFFRKYIKRGRIWVMELDVDGNLVYNILDELYTKPSENESGTIVINIEEFIKGHNLYNKDKLLNLLEFHSLYNQHTYNKKVPEDVRSLILSHIDNYSNNDIIFTSTDPIYVINNRNRSIDNILS